MTLVEWIASLGLIIGKRKLSMLTPEDLKQKRDVVLSTFKKLLQQLDTNPAETATLKVALERVQEDHGRSRRELDRLTQNAARDLAAQREMAERQTAHLKEKLGAAEIDRNEILTDLREMEGLLHDTEEQNMKLERQLKELEATGAGAGVGADAAAVGALTVERDEAQAQRDELHAVP